MPPPLRRYLEHDYDWSIAPSQAATQNQELLNNLINDRTLATFVFDINDSGFNFNDVMHALDELSKNNGEYDRIRITPQNIRAVFDSFLTILDARSISDSNREKYISLFINSLIGGASAPRVDSSRQNTIHLRSGETIAIDTIAYNAFFSRYETSYTEEEIAKITGSYDVLIEELKRRNSGDYWTPTIWTDKAHATLTEVLGNNWRNEYVVWDSCCGTKNLTRDYEFSNLYTSTLFNYELESASNYNQEAKASFVYDFLNDDLDISPDAAFVDGWKMPVELYRDLVSNKKILFLINPPYATSANQGETSKDGVSDTAISREMRLKRYSHATQQLYTQFLYRIMKLKLIFNLTDVSIGLFSPKRFMTGTKAWSDFIRDFQDDFKYEKGFYFNAGEFSDVKSNWGISFTVWSTRLDGDNDRDVFPLEVCGASSNGIEELDQSPIVTYSLMQNQLLSEWMKERYQRGQILPNPEQLHLKGALKVYDASGKPRGNLTEDSIGYIHNNGNSVEHSSKYVGIYSSAFGSGNGSPITRESFERACVVLAVRKSLIPESSKMWISGHDNFQRPLSLYGDNPSYNEDSQEWKTFVADCVVYSLFSRNGSYQSALRKVPYNGNNHDLYNEFFFMSSSEIESLANQHGNRIIKLDVNNHGGDRYAYIWLNQNRQYLSEEASNLLEECRALVRETFADRPDTIDATNHLNSWDAGFRQIYELAERNNSESLDSYLEAFNNLNDRVADWANRFKFLS